MPVTVSVAKLHPHPHVLSVLAILISNRFMSLAEYINLYTGELNVDREQEFNYPLPPSFFHVMEFLEVDDYQQFIVN